MKISFIVITGIFFTLLIPCQAAPVVIGAQALQSSGDQLAATSLSLPAGCQLYVYGATTGGARPMNAFVSGQTIQLKDANGNVAAQLAVTTDNSNSYVTDTSYHVLGGFGVSGFRYVQGFYGANPGPGPNFQASVQFTLAAPAMVAIMGMGSSQTVLALSGLDNPTIDAPVQTAQPGTEALIIAHQYLPAGAYTIQETTGDGFAGQTPENEVDLIGILVFSDEPDVATSPAPQIPIDLSAKTTQAPKLNANGTGGTLRIVSGTGSFVSVSDANNVLQVSPGATFEGTVALNAENLGSGGAIAPLIYTPSWGDPSSSWQLINGWVPTGQSVQTAQVSLTAPTAPGTYHIIFAFAWERKGDQVASASNWALGHDVWNDGNDIATLNDSQLAQAQANGYASINWQGTAGYSSLYVPVDALTIEVTNTAENSVVESTNLPPPPPKITKSHKHIPVARYLVWGVAGLAFIGMAMIVFWLISPRRSNQGVNNSDENQEKV